MLAIGARWVSRGGTVSYPVKMRCLGSALANPVLWMLGLKPSTTRISLGFRIDPTGALFTAFAARQVNARDEDPAPASLSSRLIYQSFRLPEGQLNDSDKGHAVTNVGSDLTGQSKPRISRSGSMNGVPLAPVVARTLYRIGWIPQSHAKG